MSDFSTAREAMNSGLGEPSPGENQEVSTDRAPSTGDQAPSLAITELDKMDKFKLDGQEWTLKDLKAAILRQKDYTQKTQSLSDDRKTFQSEQKFYENLAWDLMRLRENPALVSEFLKIYPDKFHNYAEQVLKNNQPQAQQSQVQQPQYDVQTMSRLERLEKFYNEQEVSKNELQINHTIDDLSKKYPDAANFREMVVGRAMEVHTQGTQLTPQVWEDIFKQVDSQVSNLIKAKYGEFIKKQQAANAKARDVGAGGGTATAAPRKFKNLSEVTKFAVDDVTGKSR